MGDTIANQTTAEAELDFIKKYNKHSEALRRLFEAGWTFGVDQMIINDSEKRQRLVAYARMLCYGVGEEISNQILDYDEFVSWLKENDLEKFLSGRLDGQIAKQEKFYQRFYGADFRIDREKIFIEARRLPAIKAGLEAGCLNYVLIKATPEALTEAETQMTGAEFFFERIMKPLKNDGFKIWAETGTDRWTSLTFRELLQRCNPVEPDEINARAFKKDWAAEGLRVLKRKGAAPKVKAGEVEIIFTSNPVDISADQKIVNKNGEMVELDNRSYISAVAENIRVLSHEEGIVLASQLYFDGRSYFVSNIWEWRRDLIGHQDKNTNPSVSVAIVDSLGGEFCLGSNSADDSHSNNRLRLAL